MLPRRALPAVGLVLVLSLAALPAAAQTSSQGELNHFTDPASQTQRDIKGLYDLIFPISMVIGILVEAFLIYFIIRYRSKAKFAAAHEEHERGHTRLEIAWTIPPAVILLIVGLLSTQTLTAIENPPGLDFTVKVTGSQWIWTFEYPDNTTTSDKMGVEQGKRVGLEIRATDVIHSFAIPALGVKIDAVPGRVNTYWFQAERQGAFLAQCMEYCAGQHSTMRAQIDILPAGSTANGWRPGGGGVGAITDCAQSTNATRSLEFRMVEGQGTGGRAWSIQPPTAATAASDVLCMEVINPAGQAAPHNLAVITPSGQEVAAYKDAIAVGRQGVIDNVRLQPGSYTYYCAIPGHRALGMEGTLTVS